MVCVNKSRGLAAQIAMPDTLTVRETKSDPSCRRTGSQSSQRSSATWLKLSPARWWLSVQCRQWLRLLRGPPQGRAPLLLLRLLQLPPLLRLPLQWRPFLRRQQYPRPLLRPPSAGRLG